MQDDWISPHLHRSWRRLLRSYPCLSISFSFPSLGQGKDAELYTTGLLPSEMGSEASCEDLEKMAWRTEKKKKTMWTCDIWRKRCHSSALCIDDL